MEYEIDLKISDEDKNTSFNFTRGKKYDYSIQLALDSHNLLADFLIPRDAVIYRQALFHN